MKTSLVAVVLAVTAMAVGQDAAAQSQTQPAATQQPQQPQAQPAQPATASLVQMKGLIAVAWVVSSTNLNSRPLWP